RLRDDRRRGAVRARGPRHRGRARAHHQRPRARGRDARGRALRRDRRRGGPLSGTGARGRVFGPTRSDLVARARRAASGEAGRAVAGAVSGALVARFRIQPFIVTLASMVFARGLAKTLAGGRKVTNAVLGADGVARAIPHPPVFAALDARVLGDNVAIVTLI